MSSGLRTNALKRGKVLLLLEAGRSTARQRSRTTPIPHACAAGSECREPGEVTISFVSVSVHVGPTVMSVPWGMSACEGEPHSEVGRH